MLILVYLLNKNYYLNNYNLFLINYNIKNIL